jgi:hypothetical protein
LLLADYLGSAMVGRRIDPSMTGVNQCFNPGSIIG